MGGKGGRFCRFWRVCESGRRYCSRKQERKKKKKERRKEKKEKEKEERKQKINSLITKNFLILPKIFWFLPSIWTSNLPQMDAQRWWSRSNSAKTIAIGLKFNRNQEESSWKEMADLKFLYLLPSAFFRFRYLSFLGKIKKTHRKKRWSRSNFPKSCADSSPIGRNQVESSWKEMADLKFLYLLPLHVFQIQISQFYMVNQKKHLEKMVIEIELREESCNLSPIWQASSRE